jgi:hypothetical protein
MSTVVPDTNINFPQEEEKIVQLWAELGRTPISTSPRRRRRSFNSGQS